MGDEKISFELFAGVDLEIDLQGYLWYGLNRLEESDLDADIIKTVSVCLLDNYVREDEASDDTLQKMVKRCDLVNDLHCSYGLVVHPDETMLADILNYVEEITESASITIRIEMLEIFMYTNLLMLDKIENHVEIFKDLAKLIKSDTPVSDILAVTNLISRLVEYYNE